MGRFAADRNCDAQFLLDKAAERGVVEIFLVVVLLPVRGEHEPVVGDLLLLLLDRPFLPGNNCLGEFRERVALARDLEGLVPAERCPLDGEPFGLESCPEGVEHRNGSLG